MLIHKAHPVYFVAAMVSILLSVASVLNVWVINPDAICYLQSASALHQGLQVAMNLCGQAKWPFYSILIAAFVKALPVSYANAAYILNSIFSAMTVVAFIGIVSLRARPLGVTARPRPLLLWMAAIVILSAHEFNAVRQYIVRDHGYWAFYLISLFFLLQYFRQPRWYFACGWSVTMCIATLFRIEGWFFLMAMPLIAFIDLRRPLRSRLRSFLQLNALNILLGVLVVAWFYTHPHSLHSYKRLEDLQFQLTHGVHFLMERYYWQGNALIHYVLGHGTAKIGAYLLFMSLLVWYITTLVNTLSIIYTLLIFYAWYQKPKASPTTDRLVLLGYIGINCFITLAFLGENMFLSERYVLALVLTLMLWVPFALEALAAQWSRRKWPLVVSLSLMVVALLGGVVNFGYSKKYIYDAGAWLAAHVPAEASLYSNDFQVMYYSNHFGDGIFAASEALIDPGVKKILAHGRFQQFDYIALRFTKKDVENNFQLLSKIPWRPLRVFQNKRGDKVLIYSTKDMINAKTMASLNGQ